MSRHKQVAVADVVVVARVLVNMAAVWVAVKVVATGVRAAVDRIMDPV